MLLVLFSTLPAMGLAAYGGMACRTQAEAAARQSLWHVTREATNEQERLIDGAHQLLTALARLPEVQRHDHAACNVLFADLLKQYPVYTGFAIANLDGDVVCSAPLLGQPLNFADRPWFQQAVQTRELVVGEYAIGRISGKATLVLAHPVLDAAGQVQGVVTVGLDLAWLNQLAAQAQLPAGAVLNLIDHNGTILARYPDAEQWVGKTFPEAPLVQAMLAQPGEGIAKVTGVDGVPRLYAFTPLVGSQGSRGAYLSVGVPTSVVYAQANRIVAHTLIGLGLVELMALTAAWAIGDMLILRRTKALSDAAQRVAAGDLTARTGLEYGVSELSELSRTFDQMTEALQAREAEREQAAATLRESQERLRTIFDAPADAITLSDLQDRRYSTVNEGFLRMTGYARDELIGQSGLDLGIWANPADLATVEKLLEQQDIVRDMECQFRAKDGSIHTGLLNAQKMMIAGKSHLLCVVRDITQYKQLQAQFLQAQKMEALGMLAGGVAHDFNNLLTAIQGYAELALHEVQETEQVTQDLQRIHAAVQRAASLTRQLLSFSRKQPMQFGPLDLNEMVQSLLKMLQRLIGENIIMEVHLQPDLWQVQGDAGSLQQVVMNLVVNAKDAMPQGGTLTVCTANVALDEASVRDSARRARLWPAVQPGRFVCLTVADTGIGMDAETMQRLFEPFFTTKGPGKGTGLGLSVVYGIVEQHNGGIHVESSPGKGSAFYIYLPAVSAEMA
jgi:PAS domain S-box-containing protein